MKIVYANLCHHNPLVPIMWDVFCGKVNSPPTLDEDSRRDIKNESLVLRHKRPQLLREQVDIFGAMLPFKIHSRSLAIKVVESCCNVLKFGKFMNKIQSPNNRRDEHVGCVLTTVIVTSNPCEKAMY